MIITTTHGKVEGFQENHLWKFLGIPYARAERFCLPEEYSWDGILKADHYGKMAIQTWRKKDAPYDEKLRAEYDEDCLNLNVYVPERALLPKNTTAESTAVKDGAETKGSADLLPVAVYIHGGGFQNGSSRWRSGEQVIRDHNLIYVSINYRLGVLGYLYLGKDLGEKWQHTGNCGTMDQLAALKWIYENIEAFGGDPKRISVFGESAGAKTQGALLLRPEMKTYCSQVLMASGSSQCIRSTTTAAEIASLFFGEMSAGAVETECSGKTECPGGTEKTEHSAAGEIYLRKEDILTMDVDKLLEIQERIVDNPGNTCMFGPVADGVVLPLDWKEKIRSGEYWSGNAMVGSCRNESIFYKMFVPDFVTKAPEIARALFGKNAQIAIAEFEELCEEGSNPAKKRKMVLEQKEEQRGSQMSDEEKADIWVRIFSDYMYRTYTRRLADQLTAKGSKVWYYSYEFGAATHVQDQGLAFGDGVKDDVFLAGIPMEKRQRMAEILYESYVRFFETGDPGWEGIPEWKPLSEDGGVMVWKDEPEIRALDDADTLQRFPEEVFILPRE